MGEGVLSKRTPHPASRALRNNPEGAKSGDTRGEN
nr:MAG TPA: hypothetical protein [Caudoviricetes sp.]DAV83933.1 MAG TPA: hypothetical protein [Caudoviricetes sp.]